MDSPRDLLLYVDDEEQALKYFRLTFAKDYEVLTATSADLAWPLIEQHAERLALVISDQRMPGRTGVDLLTAVKERCPRTVRLLTTAYSDLTSAIAAVNQGAIYAYVTKPWQIDELRVVLRQALQLYHLRCERDALLAEKLSVFHQLLLIDHARSLGMTAAGLVGQVQRPLAAAAAWIRDRPVLVSTATGAGGDYRDLWPAVLTQNRASAALGGEIGAWLGRVRSHEAPADADTIIADAAAGVGGVTVSERTPSRLDIDGRLLAAGFVELLGLLRRRLADSAANATLRVRDARGGTIIALRIAGGAGAEPIPPADRAGLSAYLAIHHHQGSVSIPVWSAGGGQVMVALGGCTDDGMEAFLTQLAENEG